MPKPIQLLTETRKRYGPAPRFMQPDIMRALWRLERRTGRARLAASLQLGEGSMRTILNRLSSLGLIDSAPMGHKLTKQGFAYLRRTKQKAPSIQPISPSKLTFSQPALSMRVRRIARKINPLQLRDEAVRAGANGSVILRFEGGRLIIPPFHAPTHREYARELAAIQASCGLVEGDVLLIAYGGSEASLERALWRAFTRL